MSRRLTSALLAGLVAIAITALLWAWFGFGTSIAGEELFFAYLFVGTFCLGALPVALSTWRRLRTSALVVAVPFVLTVYSTWSTYVAPEIPPAPVDPTPFGWFLLGWPVVAVVALLVGGVEYGLRRYRRRQNAATPE